MSAPGGFGDDMWTMFRRTVRYAGRAVHLLVITKTTCDWCGHADTECAAVMRVTETIRLPWTEFPLHSIVATLCNTCFREYWQAGGAELEAAAGWRPAGSGASVKVIRGGDD